jgi:hypothetical protein
MMFSGCREIVSEDFPELTPLPVVNCLLRADSVIQVHVSFTGKLDTIPLSTNDSAMVTCFINDTMVRDLEPKGNGYYTSDLKAQAGKIYRISVSLPGYPEISATDTIPMPVSITAIEHINEGGIDEEGYKYPSICITFPVDPDQIQYFQVTITTNYFLEKWRQTSLKDFTDPILLAEGLPIAVFSTEKIAGTTYTMQIDYHSGTQKFNEPGTHVMMERYAPLFVEFKSISRPYYQYLKLLNLYNTGRFPEFQFESYKAFPLFSNVTNGNGVVAGYSVYRSAIVYPKPWRP